MNTARKKAKTKGKREEKKEKKGSDCPRKTAHAGPYHGKKASKYYHSIELINVAFSIKL